MTPKNKVHKDEIKKVPKEQLKMKSSSKNSKLARKDLHFKESESTRVEGFLKSIDKKRQVKRDFFH